MKNAHNLKTPILVFAFAITMVLFVDSMFLMLPKFWKGLLVGKESVFSGISFQDVMWLMFFIGISEIFFRVKEINELEKFNKRDYLPAKFEDLIDDEILTEIIKKSKVDASKRWGILPYMILQISLQYRTNFSISLISDFLSKQIDIFLHQIELKFNKLKYIIWLIPSIGFMGTVYGIGLAVSKLGEGSLDDPDLLTQMANSLGIAFNTTLIALVLSVILQFLSQLYEGKEEKIINTYSKYILDNLINKIVEKK